MKFSRGTYPRGHDVTCKHCGFKLAEHEIVDEVEGAHEVAKGYKVSLAVCAQEKGGYEPKNKREWRALEEIYQKEEGPSDQGSPSWLES